MAVAGAARQETTGATLEVASVYSVLITNKNGTVNYEVCDIKDGRRSRVEVAADLIAAAHSMLTQA